MDLLERLGLMAMGFTTTWLLIAVPLSIAVVRDRRRRRRRLSRRSQATVPSRGGPA